MLPASHGTLRPVSANMRFYSQTCKHSADYPRRKGNTGSPCRGLACEACTARAPCPLRARSEPVPFVYGAGSEQAVHGALINRYLAKSLHHLPPPIPPPRESTGKQADVPAALAPSPHASTVQPAAHPDTQGKSCTAKADITAKAKRPLQSKKSKIYMPHMPKCKKSAYICMLLKKSHSNFIFCSK